MVRSEHYREQADRYARLASFKIDPEIRERLLSLAAEHGAMAEGLARAEQQSNTRRDLPARKQRPWFLSCAKVS